MSRKVQKNSDSENSDSMNEQEIYRDPFDPNPVGNREKSKRKTIRKRNYQQDFDEDQNDKEGPESEDYIFFKGGRVAKIYDQRLREGTKQKQRLCKFHSKSYIHLQWITDKEAEERQIQMPRHTKRSMENTKKQVEEIQQKFGQQHYFNPAYKKVDRILTAAVLFPIMHHKKGSEMNGKWSEPMMLVCSKMINFEQDSIPFGVIQKDEYDQTEIQTFKLKDSVKLQHVINRVYLDAYKKTDSFWIDVGISMNNLIKVYKGTEHEYHTQVLKQCIIFLYWQWYSLCRERFLKCLPEKYSQFQVKMQDNLPNVNFKLPHNPSFSFQKYAKKNFFLRDSNDEPLTQEKQIFQLYPGKFSYNWLSIYESQKQGNITDYTKFTFQCLRETDFDNLDLNKTVQPLYLVKWCDLDYDQVTWQKQDDLNCPQKVNNFKVYSKIPSKKDREKMQENKKYHKALLNQYRKDKKSKQTPQTLQKYRRKLYSLAYNKQVKQFGGDDVPVYKGYRILKNFQLQGLNWLIKAWAERRNCILADQMGLGKTIQTIAYLNHLFVFEGVIGPFLVVAPVSTLKQWRNQIQAWSQMNCVLYKGSNQSRDLIQEYQFYHKFVTNEGQFVRFQKLPRFQIMLTNYEIFVSDLSIFQKIPFQHIIVDEAHRMKNNSGKLAVSMRQLPCPRILLLTGTPIQNNCMQLWGLLNIIQPKMFTSKEQFKQKYGQLNSVQDLQKLREVLKPYMMRRVKSDVEKSIPKLSQMLINLDLTNIQKAFYRAILQKNKNSLINSMNSVAINKVSICLRQICNHPFMLSEEVEEEITSGCNTDEQRKAKFISSSSKMIFVHKFLNKCKTQGTKTLIFTQFLEMMRLLREYCSAYDIPYENLDGSVGYEERQNRIDRFNNDPEVLVFIISTKAGGVGINLTSATNIIVYDSDWNPQNDIQAIARAHRIGQKNNVTVYRLLTVQTYEDIIYKAAVKKLGIGLAILDDDYFNNSKMKNTKSGKSKDELEKLLRDGIMGFLKNDNQKQKDDGPNIENFSIDQILQQNCQKVDFQTKQCTFSKTKFEVEEEDDLKIDDPNFWQVALKDIESPLQKLVKKVKDKAQYMKICEDLLEQMKLMHEANQVVYNFIKSKITMSHFNAQEERQLKSFLDKISYERQFHKQYKSLANEWLQEIEKPSRRFTKTSSDKITEIAEKKMPEGARLTRRISSQANNNDRQKKRITRKRDKRAMEIVDSSSANDSQMIDESDEKRQNDKVSNLKKIREKRGESGQSRSSENSNSSENSDSEEDDSVKTDSKKEEKKRIEKEKKQNQGKKKIKVDLKEQIAENLSSFQNLFCVFCERRKCSKMCKAECKKLYHQICYERYKSNNHQIPTKQEIQEERWDDKKFITSLSEDFKCFECSLKVAKCFLCDEKSESVPSQWIVRGQPKRPERGNNGNDRNCIDEVLKKLSPQNKNKVFQCRMGYCQKFYHLTCLQEIKDTLPFQIYLNKEKESYPLKCPSHFCTGCQQSLSIAKSSCLRCPASLHYKCKHLKKQSIFELNNESFICRSHMSQEQIQLKIKEGDFRQTITKHQKMHEKRAKKAQQESLKKDSMKDDRSIQQKNRQKEWQKRLQAASKKLQSRHNGQIEQENLIEEEMPIIHRSVPQIEGEDKQEMSQNGKSHS